MPASLSHEMIIHDGLARAAIARISRSRYAIEREVGRGVLGHVYVAHDIRHGGRVAVKRLEPELGAVLGGERFVAEIKAPE